MRKWRNKSDGGLMEFHSPSLLFSLFTIQSVCSLNFFLLNLLRFAQLAVFLFEFYTYIFKSVIYFIITNDISLKKYFVAENLGDIFDIASYLKATRYKCYRKHLSRLFIHANKLYRHVIVVASMSRSNRFDCIARLALEYISRAGFSNNCPLPFP